MESYCHHIWTERTAVLKGVFYLYQQENNKRYFVCGKCLRIKEENNAEILEEKKERK